VTMGLGRIAKIGSLLVVLGACGASIAAAAAPAPDEAAPFAGRVGVHEGVASCAGSTCHSRPVASGLTVRQNELITWEGFGDVGAHSRAWKVLTERRAQAIANRLGIGPAQRATACLGCHADPATAGQRGARFQLSDGVSCEACHGGAGGWIASHYAMGASHAGNVARGMVALDDAKVRAARCLDCHFGGSRPGQFTTHEIMAAGHPRIAFELDLYTSLQRHYDVDADFVKRKSWPSGVKVWAVGQAMALDRALTLYGEPAHNVAGAFPEFYFFDCQSCHRSIGNDDPKWRPSAEANPGRATPAGTPPFNDENMIMLSAAAKVAAPTLAARFEADSAAFHTALAKDRAGSVGAAAKLAATSRALADALAAHGFGRADTLAIFQAVLSGEGARRYTDFAGASQAVMAADTLLNALVAQGSVDRGAAARMKPDLDRAFLAVRDPNAFRPAEARKALAAVADKVRALK
jgi:hypothetical protein